LKVNNIIIHKSKKEFKMKRKTKFVQLTIIVILLFVAMIGCKEKTETPKSATPEELSQMNKDFAQALNNKDAAAASLLYAEDASLLPPNEPIVTGRENIKKYWQAALDAGTIDVSVSTISTGSNGDLGYEIGRFTLSYPGPDGKMIVEKGKYTEILERTPDGKWISIYGIWNSDPAPSEQ
jgi:ketosteroid isomerase-like protein